MLCGDDKVEWRSYNTDKDLATGTDRLSKPYLSDDTVRQIATLGSSGREILTIMGIDTPSQ